MAGLLGADWSGPGAPSPRSRACADGAQRRRWLLRRAGRNPARVVLALLGVGALTSALACLVASHLIWNRTPSMPLGLYVLTPGAHVRRGGLVALRVPAPVRSLVHDRRYLPDGSLLIKPVAAVAGDEVCVQAGVLRIQGRPFGRVLARDAQGRELPRYEGCGLVPEGKVFLASRHPRSFDSRSFGLVDLEALKGSVAPLWTY
jgi:conjugative transfer signal peptidase TraF